MKGNGLLLAYDEDLAAGLCNGYPLCCVEWFTYVWSPVCLYLQLARPWDVRAFHVAARMLRGDHSGWVRCPRCRRGRL